MSINWITGIARKKIAFSCLIILLILTDSFAQKTIDDKSYAKSCYAYWGYGWGGQKTAVNFGFVTEFTKRYVLAFTLQTTWLTKPETVNTMAVMGTATVSPVRQTTSGTSSLLVGKVLKQPWGHFLLMAGPSLVMITKYDDSSGWFSPKYSGEEVTRPGISLQASATPSKNFIGLSTHVFIK